MGASRLRVKQSFDNSRNHKYFQNDEYTSVDVWKYSPRITASGSYKCWYKKLKLGRCQHCTGERHPETPSVKVIDVKICGEIMKTPEGEVTYKHQERRNEFLQSYNKRQRDAPLLNPTLVKNSTCFGQIYCPSSRVLILYPQQYAFVILVMLTVC